MRNKLPFMGQSLPLGEGAEQSEADEGKNSTDCKNILVVRLNSYPHQSKIKDFCRLFVKVRLPLASGLF